MNKQEFDNLPNCEPPKNTEYLLEVARRHRNFETNAYKGFSGTDRAEAPAWGYSADALASIAQGKEVEPTLALFAAKWAAYAEEQNKKVAGAKKLKHGPMAGQSCSHYKWVRPDHWELKARHIRNLVTP